MRSQNLFAYKLIHVEIRMYTFSWGLIDNSYIFSVHIMGSNTSYHIEGYNDFLYYKYENRSLDINM